MSSADYHSGWKEKHRAKGRGTQSSHPAERTPRLVVFPFTFFSKSVFNTQPLKIWFITAITVVPLAGLF